MALTLQHEASPGRHLLERYELQEFLSSDLPGRTPGNPLGHSLVEQSEAAPDGVPGERPPIISHPSRPRWLHKKKLATDYSGLKHLGKGSFGDTWQAYDHVKKKHVALKIFYDRHAPGGPRYVDWNSASATIKEDLKDNAAECSLQQWLVAQRNVYEKGAAHICQCYAEHVMDQQKSDRPCFLVLEMCGGSLYDFLHGRDDDDDDDGRNGQQPVGRQGGRLLMKQLLEALLFLNKLNMIHHDVKPFNIVVNPQTLYLKLIDFGATVRATKAWQTTGIPQTPTYSPPEAGPRSPYSFHMAKDGTGSGSFDIYAAGLMWLEAICPKLHAGYWYKISDGRATSDSAANTARQKAYSLCPEVEDWVPELRCIIQMTRRAEDRYDASKVLAMEPLKSTQDIAPPHDFPDSPEPPPGFRPSEFPGEKVMAKQKKPLTQRLFGRKHRKH
eukprot:TRINITY_DN1699_c0_g1_i1.p1 TRINITY_DN1699_c0_g1~~TRINITY_DN1699_c0_g1_i1.p1  ORF type:complete len:468 (-),score=71.44 TRINITY_DN1699_c0_g1_i1:325-1650(-)